ncbi:MAG: 50S ribosomal protein L9 [Bacteroidetes bacterium]|nr:50S ribosomal protein L9 [Bacteroidota bacterium]
MKVILKHDHELLGDEGQIVDVKNGYARNYLIPNGIATMANKSNLISHEEIKKQRKRKTEKLTADANELAGVLKSQSFEFKMKTGEEDKIFGSVTAQMIHELLEKKGFTTVERKKILLKEPIRALGEHEVEIKLQQSVVAKITVKVVNESQEEVKQEVKTEEKSDSETVSETETESAEKPESEATPE